MAGASTRQKATPERDNLLGALLSVGHATVVALGPWLFTMAALVLITAASAKWVGRTALADFRVLLIYAFSISLVAASPIVMVANRVLADAVYLGERATVAPLLLASLVVSGAASAALAAATAIIFDLKIAPAVILMQSSGLIGMIWTSLAFCGALKDFRGITLTFLAGLGVSLVATSVAASQGMGSTGLLLAFTTGLGVIFLGLGLRVLRHAERQPFKLRDAIRRLGKALEQYWVIALGAALGTIAVWIDKWVMWAGPLGQPVTSGLVHAPVYDSAVFLAYLAIIPSLARFVSVLEGEYIGTYRNYFEAIERHATLRDLEQRSSELEARTLRMIEEIFLQQAAICTIVVFCAPSIIGLTSLHYSQTSILRLAAIAALFQFLFLASTTLLLFFERHRDFLLLQAGFAMLNMLATLATIYFGPVSYGYGVLLASVASGIAAYLVLARVLQRLNYLTFVEGAVRMHRGAVRRQPARQIHPDDTWKPKRPPTATPRQGNTIMIRMKNLRLVPRQTSIALIAASAMTVGAAIPSFTQAEVPAPSSSRADQRSIATGNEVLLAPGDRIKVSFFELFDVPASAEAKGQAAQPAMRSFYQRLDLTGEYTVGLDGRLSLPRIGGFDAAERSIDDVQAAIAEMYVRVMGRDCDVNIVVQERQPIYVIGTTRTPGSFKYVPGMVVLHALSLAGGLEKSQERSSRLIDILREKERYAAVLGKLKRLLADRARLEADRDNLETATAPLRLIELAGEAETTLFMKAENALLSEMRRAFDEETKQAAEGVEAARREIAAIDQRRTQGTELMALRQQRVEELKGLAGRGVISSPNLTLARTDLVEAQARSAELAVAFAQAQHRLAQAERNVVRVQRERSARLARELTAATNDILETEKALASVNNITDAMMLAAGPGPSLDADSPSLDLEIVRRSSGHSVTFAADEMTTLAPGDILRVKSRQPRPASEPRTLGNAAPEASVN